MTSRELRRTIPHQTLESDAQPISDQDSAEEDSAGHSPTSPNPNPADDNEFLRTLHHPSPTHTLITTTPTPTPTTTPGRSLMDAIRKEQKLIGSGTEADPEGLMNRRSFKDRAIKERPASPPKAAANFTRSVTVRTTEPEPEPHDSENPLSFLSRPADNSAGSGMSLMALLGQSGSFEDSDYEGEDDDDEEEEEEVEEVLEHTCCICMVKHSGQPFVPCGHTLCRLCSSELCVDGKNCPLCNGFIMEILDVF